MNPSQPLRRADTVTKTDVERALRWVDRYGSFAALEQLVCVQQASTDPTVAGLAEDGMGLILVRHGRVYDALDHFSNAADVATDPVDYIRFRMHEALALSWLSQHDRAQRLLTRLAAGLSEQTVTPLRIQVYSNLAFVQSHSEFYREAMENSLRALQDARELELHIHEQTLENNIGHFYVEFGDYANAEPRLLQAMDADSTPLLATVTELCRLYFLQQRFDESLQYGEQAVRMVWSSVLNFEREAIAFLCNVLAHLARHSGETGLAMRLLEKSQLLFGQLAMWNRWQQSQVLMDEWLSRTEHQPRKLTETAIDLDEIREFLFLFDAMNAQELTMREFANLTDARVETVQALCETAHVQGIRREHLIYAARFADYGLTALEPEVLRDPARSPEAWRQYQTHPDLGVRMLQVTALPKPVLDMIRDHHEHWDGSGYPAGKRGSDFSEDVQLLSAADRYAAEVVLEQRSHSDALLRVRALSGTWLSPFAVDTLIRHFQGSVDDVLEAP